MAEVFAPTSSQMCWSKRLGNPYGPGAFIPLILNIIVLTSSVEGIMQIELLISSVMTLINRSEGRD